ncbi:FecR domain-containing protein [Parabacteroides sp.]|uniref:FecR family protein n=1 Tax=Parabacteroides sp. TaxID=1869337 RepID=UPI00307FD56E
METNTTDINLIIIRYLDGSATLEEKILLLHWLKQSDENRENFTDTRDLWISCNAATTDELEVDIALERLKSRIMSVQGRQPVKKVGAPFVRWYQIAAVFLFFLGMGYWFGFSNRSSQPELLVRNQLITAKGSKGKFSLPDGTIVWLNSESSLSYPEQFAGEKRTVNLNGGAYFEVVKNTERPFIVRTGDIDIEVLGTSFNVSAYSSHESIETALLTGSVKITGTGMDKDIFLKPDEVFEYEKTNHISSVKPVNASLYADWIKDRLVFDNTRLSDILISMEGWYNIEIVCPEKFAQSTQMSFTIRQENIEEILKAMSFIAPIRYRIEGEKAYITPIK